MRPSAFRRLPLLSFFHRFGSLARVCATLRLPAATRVTIGVCVAGAVLIACSPTFDWRTISNDDVGYTVDL
ncbi:MAG TPA: hypothetical protein VEI25_09700, partial [Paraburkholderia sp.]|nr:hypothetical protein [Paraburkholderia sp.]